MEGVPAKATNRIEVHLIDQSCPCRNQSIWLGWYSTLKSAFTYATTTDAAQQHVNPCSRLIRNQFTRAFVKYLWLGPNPDPHHSSGPSSSDKCNNTTGASRGSSSTICSLMAGASASAKRPFGYDWKILLT